MALKPQLSPLRPAPQLNITAALPWAAVALSPRLQSPTVSSPRAGQTASTPQTPRLHATEAKFQGRAARRLGALVCHQAPCRGQSLCPGMTGPEGGSLMALSPVEGRETSQDKRLLPVPSMSLLRRRPLETSCPLSLPPALKQQSRDSPRGMAGHKNRMQRLLVRELT